MIASLGNVTAVIQELFGKRDPSVKNIGSYRESRIFFESAAYVLSVEEELLGKVLKRYLLAQMILDISHNVADQRGHEVLCVIMLSRQKQAVNKDKDLREIRVDKKRIAVFFFCTNALELIEDFQKFLTLAGAQCYLFDLIYVIYSEAVGKINVLIRKLSYQLLFYIDNYAVILAVGTAGAGVKLFGAY